MNGFNTNGVLVGTNSFVASLGLVAAGVALKSAYDASLGAISSIGENIAVATPEILNQFCYIAFNNSRIICDNQSVLIAAFGAAVEDATTIAQATVDPLTGTILIGVGAGLAGLAAVGLVALACSHHVGYEMVE